MANNSVIGALRVDLVLNSAQFTTGLKNASKGLNKFGVQMTLGLETVANQLGRVIGAIPRAIKASIDHADALGKSAQKAGTTVEALSRLEYAAKLSDVSLESLTGGLQKLGKSMADAVATPTSTAATAFKALGVELTNTDGTLRNSDVVLADIAERFSKLEDGSTKTALAMQMFGKSGAELIPLLNSGRDGLKSMADESDRLGATISTKTAKAAERFNDTLTTVQVAMQGVVNKVISDDGVMGALQGLADLLASPEFADAAQTAATNIISAMGRIIGWIADVKSNWQALQRAVDPQFEVYGADGKPKTYNGQPMSSNIEDRTTPGWKDERQPGGAPGQLMINTTFGLLGNGETYATPEAMWAALTPPKIKFEFDDPGAAAAAAKVIDDQLKVMNEDLASQKSAWEEMQQPIRELADTVGSALSGAMSGLVSDLIKGKDAVGGLIDAFGSLGDRLIQMAMDQAIQGLLGSLMGGLLGGGGLGVGKGLTGAATYGFTGNGVYGIPGFDGGGYTGMGGRSGGMDGKGGFLAMLHPDETVLDHTKGQGAGPSMIFNITGSRQDAAEIARVAETTARNVLRTWQTNPDR